MSLLKENYCGTWVSAVGGQPVQCCDKVARFKVYGETGLIFWYCAEHYDMYYGDKGTMK